MSTTILDQHHPPREGFPTKGSNLSLTQFGSAPGRIGLQVTIGGKKLDIFQYVLLDEDTGREVYDAIGKTFGFDA